jgi:D-3-phosphoglycerate dehydrogenase
VDNNKPIVLVTEPIADVGLELLQKQCEVRTPWVDGRTPTDNDLAEASAIIVRLVRITESLLSKAAGLKVVGRHGVGLDTVDLEAATLRGIPVVYTPHINANAVAEHAFSLMLSLARHIVGADRVVRQSLANIRDLFTGIELRHRILGVIGLGAIGRRVAEIGYRGFEMQIVGYDPFMAVPASHDFVKQVGSLRELLEQAEVITLHVPLTPQTRHMINSESLAWMKSSSVLINTCRGAVIDTTSLAVALNERRVGGAALDVFEAEPLSPDHPLQSAPRVVFSPHIAGSTVEARSAMSEVVARQVLQVLRGETPDFLANPQVLSKIRLTTGSS